MTSRFDFTPGEIAVIERLAAARQANAERRGFAPRGRGSLETHRVGLTGEAAFRKFLAWRRIRVVHEPNNLNHANQHDFIVLWEDALMSVGVQSLMTPRPGAWAEYPVRGHGSRDAVVWVATDAPRSATLWGFSWWQEVRDSPVATSSGGNDVHRVAVSAWHDVDDLFRIRRAVTLDGAMGW